MVQAGFKRENCHGGTAAPNYRDWQHALVRPFLGGSVLEVGSGMGYFSATLVNGGHERVVLTESDRECLERLHESYSGLPKVEVLPWSLPGKLDIGKPVESVVAMNVLEHIEDHVGALRDLSRVVTPGGRIVLWVPAHMSLYGDFDRAVGHVRRYTKQSLGDAVQEAGLQIRALRDVNFLGGLAWWLAVRRGKAGYPRPKLVSMYDKVLVPVSRAVEGIVTAPFGQSVLCAAEVPRS